jgi:broad specificity phosphatase PhoE
VRASTDLWLVRHGHSEHHRQARLQWPEAPLSEEGHRQAKLLAQRLARLQEVAGLYSSPLPRAWHTALPIANALKLEASPLDNLREIDFGQAGGLTMEEFRQRWPDQVPPWEDFDNLEFQWPGGESRWQFQKRAVSAMEGLVQAHPGQRIIVVAHTGPLRCYLAHLFLGHPSRWREIPLQPASVSQVKIGPEGARILFHDDVSHLEATSGPIR